MSFKVKLFVAQADRILLTQVYRKGEYTCGRKQCTLVRKGGKPGNVLACTGEDNMGVMVEEMTAVKEEHCVLR